MDTTLPTASDFTFNATSDTSVDARLQPVNEPIALLILAHGAGADHRHAHMQSISEALAHRHISTLRFNFPYMQAGKPRTDKPEICIESLNNARAIAFEKAAGKPLLMGGHSFGGRMSSHYGAEYGHDAQIDGLIYFSFPLHSGAPDRKRATHLPQVTVPQLFLSGTRDKMADPALLATVVDELPLASLHPLHTGDHSYKILKRTRSSEETIYEEAARVAAEWIVSNC
ncbi:MAG: alpha/beta fold hydrolase [Pseudomonadota bacterium]